MNRNHLSRYIAEFLGTFAIVFFGCGSIASMQGGDSIAKHIGVNGVFGLTVAAMIYALGPLSAAHFNPAVTLGFTSAGRFPHRHVLPYLLAQFGGAICASLCHSLLFRTLATSVDFGATLPHLGVGEAFGIEVILTFFLMLVIIANATDNRVNGAVPALAIGMTVILCGVFGGSLSGCSMNPARSLAPALFAGTGAISTLWVYLIAPPIGAVFAAQLYERMRLSPENAQSAPADLT